MEKEAQWWKVLDKSTLQCELCPHGCKLREGKVGLCGVRKNVHGKLHTLIYAEATAVNVDPIEKKPLYHFHPGQPILSLGTKGCNLACAFCQNWHISQNSNAHSHVVSPEEAVSIARQNNSFGIAFTYSEPLIWWEYVFDTARLAHEHGLKNVLVTNGYIKISPLKKLLPYIDAMNIDMKSFDPLFYKKVCGGQLKPVMDVCEKAKKSCHVEITNLVVPFKDEEEILKDVEKMVEWIASNFGKETPLHFSRYFPNYKYNKPQTPADLLSQACDVATRKLLYVYQGNIHSADGSNTYCPKCNALLVKRLGYHTIVQSIENGRCSKCNREVDLVGV